MDLRIFNYCLGAGWLLVLVGGCWWLGPAGLCVAGLLLILLTLVGVRLAGGLVTPEAGKKG